LDGTDLNASGHNRLPLFAAGVACLAVVLVVGALVWYAQFSGGAPGAAASDGLGVAPQLETVSPNWLAAPRVTTGLTVRYPPDWQVDQPSAGRLVLRQPGSSNDGPVPKHHHLVRSRSRGQPT
jgi:hypothetical protein